VQPRKGKSHALNTALANATGDLLAFIDDDQRVATDFFVEVCRAATQRARADMFCGRLLPDWTGGEPAWVHVTGPYRIAPLPIPNFELGPSQSWIDRTAGAMPSGGNLIVRLGCANRIGLFSTQLGPTGHDLAGGEDSEWIQRALALGACLSYEPGIVQRHYVDPARLKLGFMMRLTYFRTSAAVAISGRTAKGGIPLWALRKTLTHVLLACTALGSARRRHYMLRAAAAAGEIDGHYRRRIAGGA
jgi:glycosyltransferase involved in cell wall biosynthesis